MEVGALWVSEGVMNVCRALKGSIYAVVIGPRVHVGPLDILSVKWESVLERSGTGMNWKQYYLRGSEAFN